MTSVITKDFAHLKIFEKIWIFEDFWAFEAKFDAQKGNFRIFAYFTVRVQKKWKAFSEIGFLQVFRLPLNCLKPCKTSQKSHDKYDY